MIKLKNKVVAITGAASGIGKELALQFAQRGADLALNDWNKDDLSTTVQELQQYNTNILEFPFDVRDRQSWIGFSNKIQNHFGHLDILINNAGIAQFTIAVEDMSVEDFSNVFDTNIWGYIHGVQTMIPLLRMRSESSIVNICSSFGLVSFPNQAAYIMSKFAIKGLTETLQLENRKQKNFHVMGVYPGGVRTNLVKNIKHHDKEQLNKLIHIFDKYTVTTTTQVATKVINGIESKKQRVIVGKDARFMDLISRFFPRLYAKFIPKVSLKKPSKVTETVPITTKKIGEAQV